MILNGNTSTDDFYQRRRRARAKPAKKTSSIDKQLDGNPNGSLEEKCAWLRARQQNRAKRGGK